MRWRFQAGLRSRRHLHLVIFTFATLLALTIASQLEMFALGFLSDQGSDFFALFGRRHHAGRHRCTMGRDRCRWQWGFDQREGWSFSFEAQRDKSVGLGLSR